jgi:hypothetical protein
LAEKSVSSSGFTFGSKTTQKNKGYKYCQVIWNIMLLLLLEMI